MEGTFREEVAYREDFDDYELGYSGKIGGVGEKWEKRDL